MACGRPVAVTELPATQEYASECVAYFEKDSLDSAISSLIRLKKNKDLRLILGTKARTRMVEKYSWEKIAGMFFDLY